MSNKKKILERSNTESKTFNYVKGDVSLNFTLRTDIKQQLKDFLECLEVAVKEVKEELDKK